MARDEAPPEYSLQLRSQAAAGGSGGEISGQVEAPAVQSWMPEAAASESLLLQERARPVSSDSMRKCVRRSVVKSLPPPCSQICSSSRADESNSQRRASKKARYLESMRCDCSGKWWVRWCGARQAHRVPIAGIANALLGLVPATQLHVQSYCAAKREVNILQRARRRKCWVGGRRGGEGGEGGGSTWIKCPGLKTGEGLRAASENLPGGPPHLLSKPLCTAEQ